MPGIESTLRTVDRAEIEYGGPVFRNSPDLKFRRFPWTLIPPVVSGV